MLCRTCVAWVCVVAPSFRHTMPCSGCGRTLAVLPGKNTMGNPICELCSDIERVKELLKESEAHIKSVNAYERAVRYDMVAAAIKSVKNHLTEALATDSSSDQPMAPQGGQSPQGAASYGAGDSNPWNPRRLVPTRSSIMVQRCGTACFRHPLPRIRRKGRKKCLKKVQIHI